MVKSLAPLGTGTLVYGRYKIIKEIGAGAFSTVYEVNDIGSGKSFALKELAFDKQHIDYQSGLDIFENEAEVLKSIGRKKGVPRFYDRFSFGSREYVVTDFVKGESLDDILIGHANSGTAFNDGKIAEIGRNLLNVLGVVHGSGFFHGDVKPNNILIDADGKLTLVDYGNSAKIGSSSNSFGTPPFAAPEQYNSGVLDRKTDLYGAGMVLDALLNPSKYQPQNQNTVRMPLVTPINSGSALNVLIQKLTQQDKAFRYDSSGKAVKELNRISGGSGGFKKVLAGFKQYLANDWNKTKREVKSFYQRAAGSVGGIVGVCMLTYAVALPIQASSKWHDFKRNVFKPSSSAVIRTIDDGININFVGQSKATEKPRNEIYYATHMTGDGRNHFLIIERKDATESAKSVYDVFYFKTNEKTFSPIEGVYVGKYQHAGEDANITHFFIDSGPGSSSLKIPHILEYDDAVTEKYHKQSIPHLYVSSEIKISARDSLNIDLQKIYFNSGLRKLYNKSKKAILKEFKEGGDINPRKDKVETPGDIINRWTQTK